MNVSDVTGLPVLPEGERWVVREERACSEGYMYSSPINTGHLEVVLERLETFRDVKRRGWWRRDVIESGSFWRVVAGTAAVRVQGDHPVAVLNAANVIVKRRARWEARESLKGAYPPKGPVSS